MATHACKNKEVRMQLRLNGGIWKQSAPPLVHVLLRWESHDDDGGFARGKWVFSDPTGWRIYRLLAQVKAGQFYAFTHGAYHATVVACYNDYKVHNPLDVEDKEAFYISPGPICPDEDVDSGHLKIRDPDNHAIIKDAKKKNMTTHGEWNRLFKIPNCRGGFCMTTNRP